MRIQPPDIRRPGGCPHGPSIPAVRTRRILLVLLAAAPLLWSAPMAGGEAPADPKAPAAAAAAPPAGPAPNEAPAKPGLMPSTQAMWKLFGRLHILVVHFPIALLTVAALLEAWALLRRSPTVAPGAPLLLILGCLGALASAAKGWVHAGFGTYTGNAAQLLAIHRWLGIAAAVFSVLILLLLARARRGDPKRVRLYRASVLAGALLVGAAAHFGGSLTHGADFLDPWSIDPAPAAGALFPADGKVAFATHVQPILQRSCVECHGIQKQKGGLRLDGKAAAFKGGNDGQVIIPGKAAESILLKRVLGEGGEDRMPLNKPPLPDDEIRILTTWIEVGAEWPEEPGAKTTDAQIHWSYRKPEYAPPPPAERKGWARGGMDHFILARLEREGLQPSPEADRRTLIRRLSFDLTGLPPSPEAVEAFASDGSPDAWERLVERLLASVHYGERMAVFWLDLVRYADSIGYHSDNQQEVDAYRDWVIDAFNRNRPFDRFTIEQLAGDLLPGSGTEEKVASGYNRLNMTTEEGGAQDKEYRAKYASDRVRNYTSVWLAATVGCAECHNHKFDPYTAKDFYSLAAFFADVRDPPVGKGRQGPLVDGALALPTPEQAEARRRAEESVAALKARMAGSPPPAPQDLEGLKKELVEAEKRRDELDASCRHSLMAISDPPRVTRILPRGNWMDETGPIVEPAVPPFLDPVRVEGRRPSRLDLAEWTVSRANPLASRVMVNRLWRIFFGVGLSKTLGDLGTQGEPPSHPELLDWLAVEFMDSGWDMKHMVRLMVLSSTYRQDSSGTKELRDRDPYNRLLARQGRFRLDAEFVRDNALAVSGLLAQAVGGPSVKPYQPAGYWDYLNFPVRTWQSDHGPALYRRGLYTWWQRTFLHPSLQAFDAPSREECAAERARSNTPLQALVLLDDPTYVEAARVFAERILREGGSTPAERLAWAWRKALGRPPRPEEARIVEDLVTRHLESFGKDRKAAEDLVQSGEAPAPKDADAPVLAAWTSAARAILNLGETVTRS